jgi:fibronectin-binding autotransporter adhesin
MTGRSTSGRGAARTASGLPWYAVVGVALAVCAVLGATGRRAQAACSPSICVGAGSSCTISGTNTIDDDCILDLSTKNVTLTGTLKTASDGQNFTIKTIDFDVQGTIQARGAPALTPLDIQSSGFFKTRVVSNSPATVDVSHSGNVTVTASGLVSIDGKDFTADGISGAVNGGGITITAGTTFASTKDIHANGSTTGDGGSISLTSTSSNMTIGGDVLANGSGSFAFGGDITLDSGGTLTVTKRLQTLGDTDGDGGSIDITAASTASFSGTVKASGGSTGGTGGDMAVTATDVTITAGWTSTGGTDSDGGAVSITATAGGINLNGAGVNSGTITTDGGSGGSGADVDLDATGGAITQSGTISSSGSGGFDGGTVSLTSNQNVTSSANITATGTGDISFGGTINLTGGTNHTASVSSILDARSTTSNGGFDGTVDVEACTVSVTGTLKTRNTSVGLGENLVVYKNTYTLSAAGSMLSDSPAPTDCATATTGNVIKCRCVDGNGDGICDSPVSCVNNPSLSGTVTPTALVCPIPLPACQ